MQEPKAIKKEKELLTHGDKRIDPYFWMRKRDTPEVLDYLKLEADYFKSQMSAQEKLKDELFEELKSKVVEDDTSAPVFYDGYYYYHRVEAAKEYTIYCRKKDSLDNPEEIYLDVNELAKGNSFFAVHGVDTSPDHTKVAFGVDNVGRNQFSLYVKDITTGVITKDIVTNIWPSMCWANDNETIFYTGKNEQTLRAESIRTFNIETKEDKLIFFEKDEAFSVSPSKDILDKYIFIESDSTITTESYFMDANDPKSELKLFCPREREHEYYVSVGHDRFYITSNKNAINFKVMECPLDNTDIANWKEVIPHRSDTLIDHLLVLKNHIILQVMQDGIQTIESYNKNDLKPQIFKYNDPVYEASLGVNPLYDSSQLRYQYSSLTTPTSVYQVDLNNLKQVLLKQQEIKGGHTPENYVSKRVFATSHDGVKIPISLVYSKGLDINESTPLLQYAYGSYGYSMPVSFRRNLLSLLDRGFIYAIAHIRGGSEMGRHWYEDGKMLKKKNTFIDFVECSKFLIKEKFTSPKHLYAMGGSAGGLLMGAVMNMAPELYNGVIAAVPFVDVVTTMLDETIPLTTFEYDEWGNPNNADYYEYMKSYSPYDNVMAKKYPNTLIITGYHDSQVQYWEPAKWVAKLREVKTDKNLLLFKIDMEAGHSGTTGRYKALEETAYEYAFLLKLETL